MPIYPSHIQQFFNSRLTVSGLDKQALVDKYFDYLGLKNQADSPVVFQNYLYVYLNGHVGGFSDGVKYASLERGS